MPEKTNRSIIVMELTNFHKEVTILSCLNAKKTPEKLNICFYAIADFFVIELPPLFESRFNNKERSRMQSYVHFHHLGSESWHSYLPTQASHAPVPKLVNQKEKWVCSTAQFKPMLRAFFSHLLTLKSTSKFMKFISPACRKYCRKMLRLGLNMSVDFLLNM